ncbi:type II toxin-antitoxin system RelE/ParE family toxin [Nocardia sp. NPDC049149]|uniref:type II toxin-antitoxin system RelE/ParE family toxin n=1 Tax=Nocardia sp. NPDC049149 TaxID=3364315 RepID=UPI00371078D4
MRWSILLLEPVNDWFLDLVKNEPMIADKIEEALDELAERGPELGRPLVDRIQSSKALHNLKELRPRTPAGSEIRMLFVFDPMREAIVLVAGDKSGQWNRWYRDAIPLAEQRYKDYRATKDES